VSSFLLVPAISWSSSVLGIHLSKRVDMSITVLLSDASASGGFRAMRTGRQSSPGWLYPDPRLEAWPLNPITCSVSGLRWWIGPQTLTKQLTCAQKLMSLAFERTLIYRIVWYRILSYGTLSTFEIRNLESAAGQSLYSHVWRAWSRQLIFKSVEVNRYSCKRSVRLFDVGLTVSK